MSYELEICAASLHSARAAQAGGAHRIELCQNLEQGGITPSYGLIRQVRAELRIPVFVLIRPRPGDFVYDAAELAIMRRDIALCRELGCAGVVLGALDAAGRVDQQACRPLLAAAGPLAVTFHRAFDACPDQLGALEDLVALGCQRVLTSGGQPSAAAGLPQLAALTGRAAGRIRVMPGAGLSPVNLRAVALGSGARDFHSSARRPLAVAAAPGPFGPPPHDTDAATVAAMAALLRELGAEQAGASQ